MKKRRKYESAGVERGWNLKSQTIFGIGIDLIEKRKIRKIIRTDYFEVYLERWFSEQETSRFKKHPNPIKEICSSLAIKESFIKSSNGRYSLKDIKVINVRKDNGTFHIELEKDNFLKDKVLKIDVAHTEELCICTLILFLKCT